MAKVTITIEDKPGDGGPGVGISVEFDPQITRGIRLTPAQTLGAQLADAMMGKENLVEGFGDIEDEDTNGPDDGDE